MSYTPTRTELSAAKILESAAELLETKGWTQGYYARDAKGLPVACSAPHAVAFCALGALHRAGRKRALSSHDTALLGLADQIGGDSIGRWNDKSSRRKSQVIAAMRKTAKRLRGEGILGKRGKHA